MAVEQFLFTHRPRGTGVDSNAPGFQIGAWSSRLDARSQQLITDACMHYRVSLYDNGPRAARNAETAFRRNPGDADEIPRQILDMFPVIWAYDPLGDGRFALIRICYLGYTPGASQRPGNLLAHGLIFSPQDLAGHGGNPLSLARCALWQTADLPDVTDLAPLADLGAPCGRPSLDALQRPAVRDHVAAMLTALWPGDAAQPARPVLLCLEQWQEAALLVEALLALLPPEQRGQVSLCTYECDRQWSPAEPPVQPYHRLVVLLKANDRPYDFGAAEYDSRFFIFNFAENRTSDVGRPGAYASLVQRCVQAGHPEYALRYQEFLREFGLADRVAAWDEWALIGELVFLDETAAATVIAATKALGEHATTPERAALAVAWVEPHLLRLAVEDEPAAVAALAPEFSVLVDAMEPTAARTVMVELEQAAAARLTDGHTRAAAALLDAGGREHDRLLQSLLGMGAGRQAGEWPRPHDPADQAELVDLLGYALSRRLARPGEPGVPTAVAVAVFRTAADLNLADRAWQGEGGRAVEGFLSREWDADRQEMAMGLVEAIKPGQSPAAALWLRSRLIHAATLSADELRELVRVAGALTADARRVPDGARVARQIAADLRNGRLAMWERASLLSIMAVRMRETGCGEELLAAYDDTARQVTGEDRANLLRELAKLKPTLEQLFAREALRDLRPWGDPGARAALDRLRPLLEPPTALAFLYREVVKLSQEEGLSTDDMALTQELVRLHRAGGEDEPELARLCSAVIAVLPIAPLDDGWHSVFEKAAPERLDERTRHRLAALQLMRRVDRAVRQDPRAIEQFPHDDPAWHESVPALSPADRDSIVHWATGLFVGVEFHTTRAATALLGMLEAAGHSAPEQVLSAIDRVTQRPDKQDRALALGVVAATVRVREVRPEVLRRYDQAVGELGDDERNYLLGELAQEGCSQPVARVLYTLLAAQAKSGVPLSLGEHEDLLIAHPRIADDLCGVVGHGLSRAEGDAVAPFLAVAPLVLATSPTDVPAGRGTLALWTEAAQRLPMEPLPDNWQQLLPRLPPETPRGNAARLQTMVFLRYVSDLARAADWSLAKLPRDHSVFTDALPLLPQDERDMVMAFCLNTFAGKGISSRQEADDLMALLTAAGHDTPDQVRAAVDIVLAGQDGDRGWRALAFLAEAAQGRPAGSALLDAYAEGTGNLTGDEQGQHLEELAKMGAWQLFASQLLRALLPWGDGTRKTFSYWRTKVLDRDPQVLDRMCRQFADVLTGQSVAGESLPLAREMAAAWPNNREPGPGLEALLATVVQVVELPPPEDLMPLLDRPLAGANPAAAQRHRVIRFMRARQHHPVEGLAAFPVTDDAWVRDAASLPAADRERLVLWCADLFRDTG